MNARNLIAWAFRFASAGLLLILTPAAKALDATVTKTSGTNEITGNLVFGPGKTLTVASGATLIIQAGATFNFGASLPWSTVSGTPTNIAGYGILDAVSTGQTYPNPSWLTSLAASKLTGSISAAQLPAFSGGDVTSSAGSAILSLATVNAGVGTFGDSTHVPTITVNAKGQITAAGSTAIAFPTFNQLSPMVALGDSIYGGNSGTVQRLAGNITTTRKFWSQTGTGSVSAAPVIGVLLDADIPATLTGKNISGATNTLSAIPASALTGTVSRSNGGTGQTGYANGQLLIGKADGSLAKATLTQGANISITNGDGTIAIAATGGSGTVTNVSVVTANGISGSVAGSTTTPAITLSLGAIAPSSVNGVAISGSSTPTLAVSGTTAVSGTNTGDQTSVTGNAGTASALQTARTINGVSFNGTANVVVPAAAGTLTGTDLAANVVNSSLTGAAGGSFGSNAYSSTAFAPLASPALTGTPTAPTASNGTNTTQLATTAFVLANQQALSPASPTAQIGLSNVPGVSAAYMRADAAPALSQAIAPLWTGLHTHDAGTGALPAAIGSPQVIFAGAAASPNSVESNAWLGSSYILRARSSGGNRGLGAATPDAQDFFNFEGYGFGTAYTTTPNGSYRLKANGIWSGANRGTYHVWSGTPNGSLTQGDWMTLKDGVLSVDRVASAGTLPAAYAGVSLRLSGTDSVTNGIEGIAYGAGGLRIDGRSFGGNRATPSATTADLPFYQINASGYDTAVNTSTRAQFGVYADGLWSISNNGTYYRWTGTANGSTSLVNWMTLRNGILSGPAFSGTSLTLSGNITQSAANSINNQASITTAGTSNNVRYQFNSDTLGGIMQLDAYSSTYTTNAYQVANGVGLAGNGSGGLALVAGNGSGQVKVYAGGPSSLAAIFSSDGATFKGTATTGNASAGYVGEYIENVVEAGGAVTSLTSATAANVLSITLTPGDWDLGGTIGFVPSGTTSVTQIVGGYSTNATPTLPTSTASTSRDSFSATVPSTLIIRALPRYRLSVSVNTDVYLSARATFTVSTMSAFGNINARRVR